jgi:hypothetical protein
VKQGRFAESDGRLTLPFEDPEGQRLALVDDGGKGDPPAAWDRSPVPVEHQIRGLGGDVVLVDGPDLAQRVAAAVGDAPIRLGIDAVAGDATRRLGSTMADGGVVAMWHGDAGYETGDAEALGPRHRLWMVDAGWRYERHHGQRTYDLYFVNHGGQ